LEKIISDGQATPPGEWLDQENDEWVLLLKGSAGLRFAGESGIRTMRPGDAVNLPARLRHRVEWTECGAKTIWLALHYPRRERSEPSGGNSDGESPLPPRATPPIVK
jgi:cupin 2 domain-containing protein